MITQGRPKKKETGKRYKAYRAKRLYEKGRNPTFTKLGEFKAKKIRTRGGNNKVVVLQANKVNLFSPNDKKFHRVVIKEILDNKANRNYVRRNIITKGTVVNTELGKAKITSRPGQDGTMNAVPVE